MKESFNIKENSKTKEIQNLINKNDAKEAAKSLFEIALKIESLVSVPKNAVAEIIINTIAEDDSVLKACGKPIAA